MNTSTVVRAVAVTLFATLTSALLVEAWLGVHGFVIALAGLYAFLMGVAAIIALVNLRRLKGRADRLQSGIDLILFSVFLGGALWLIVRAVGR